MATSGTYTFTVTQNDIIKAAFRKLQVYAEGDTVPPTALSDASFALNVWIKSLCMKGYFLWCVQDIPVPMVAAQAAYQIGPLSNQPRPLRILDAYIRNSQGNDVKLTITSRYDYDTLGQKAASGIPNQLYYDPQLNNGIVTLYNVPIDATQTVHLVIQRQIQDFNLSTDNPDFPQEAFNMLVWGLADQIGLDYSVRADVLTIVERRAAQYLTEFSDFQQAQEASTFFTPSERGVR